jgi:CelD/BcsL family acetyltransferase involved in cellulose biosynthesis
MTHRGDGGRSSTSPDRVLTIRAWTRDEFESSSLEWSELLLRSNADPLFMSWEWQSLWWRFFGNVVGSKLYVLAGYDESGRLVGLAPLCLKRAFHKGLGAFRLESIGSSFRGTSEVFSEYLDLIIDRQFEASFIAAVAETIRSDDRWSDLVFSNTPADGHAVRLVSEHFGQQYLRNTDPLISYRTEIPGKFASYLQALDANTRRRVWNQRQKLTSPALVDVCADRIDDTFDVLDRFHATRWGRAHYVGRRRDFNRTFARQMATKGALKLTELRCAGVPLSVMYNIRVGYTEYNIQTGFDALSLKGISPGYLHFGYAMERASQQGVRVFDFLAGKGLNRDYKRDFSTQPRALVTLQSIRTKALAWVYREYDRRFLRFIGGLAPAGWLVDATTYTDSLCSWAGA